MTSRRKPFRRTNSAPPGEWSMTATYAGAVSFRAGAVAWAKRGRASCGGTAVIAAFYGRHEGLGDASRLAIYDAIEGRP